jgi:hypothetical protein
VELKDGGEIPLHLRIRRYGPFDKENKQVVAYVLEFLRFHGPTNTIECFTCEVVGTIAPRRIDSRFSFPGQAMQQKTAEERHRSNHRLLGKAVPLEIRRIYLPTSFPRCSTLFSKDMRTEIPTKMLGM